MLYILLIITGTDLKRTDLTRMLKEAGFMPIRQGKHEIWSNGKDAPIPVPRHKEINEITAKGILKDAGILKHGE